MGRVVVRSVAADPKNTQRQIVKVRALGYCQHSGLHGARLELSSGEELCASIAQNVFPDLAVNAELDGGHFCRCAIGHVCLME